MVPQDKLKNVKTGQGFVVGEIASTPRDLHYLKPGCIVTLFDGVDTALDWITKELPKTGRGASEATGRDEFNAFDTYEDAMTTFRSSPETIVKFDPSEVRIKDESEAGSQVEYDVTGDFIDMGRFMEGVPESVGTMHNGNARNRRVNITINLNQWAGIDHKDIAHRGERILRLIDALEGGGIRCQLTGIESSECDHVEVKIKHHDEPLTISDLAVITHPEFLRRAIFRIIEHSKTFSWDYGSARTFGEAVKPEHIESDNNDEMNLFIDGNLTNIRDIDRRFDQLEKLLVWEMSKPIPEVDAIKVSSEGVYFQPNGARGEEEIRREGKEVINNE